MIQVSDVIFGCFEGVVFYDRNPESMRTVPRVCPAGRDSVSTDAADEPEIDGFVPGKCAVGGRC